MIFSTYLGFKEKNVDLVYAISTPLTIGVPALFLKKTKKVPFIFEVLDLWPAVPIQMGALKNKVLIQIAIGLERMIYRNASHIVAASPGMQEGIVKCNIPASKVTMIPNMAKTDSFYAQVPDLILANALQIDSKTFNVIYFGTLGKANAIEYIMETVLLLKDDPGINFYFTGQGAMLQHIENICKENAVKNCTYLGFYDLETMGRILNLCHVSLVTFSDFPILSTNSPSKLFDSLSAGIPVIVNSPGWTKDLIKEHNCGLYVNPHEPMDFASKIRFLRDSPKLCLEMGKNARSLAESTFHKTILVKQAYGIMNEVITGTR